MSVRRLFALSALAAAALLSGCATTVNADGERVLKRQSEGQKADPWENWNRKVFAFNEGLDQKVLKPVATGWKNVTPSWVRTGVGNFFRNVQDAWSAVNHLLQGKVQSGMEMMTRFEANTVFGVLGLVDVATDMGLERNSEDFGQTLGRWGFAAGPYIVWPLLGPSSVRDSVGLPLDRAASPASLFSGYATYLELTTLQIVNTRSELLNATDMLDQIALDKYSFVRDGYLARRRSLVYDGNPPEDKAADEGLPPGTGTGTAAPEAAQPASAPASAAS